MNRSFLAVPFVLMLGALRVAVASSSDGDGVPDVLDNCINVANAPPYNCDTDMDGYGNLCDGDFDQSFFLATRDYVRNMLPDFSLAPPASNCGGFDCTPAPGGTNVTLDGTNMDCSADGTNDSTADGSVTAADVAIWWDRFFSSGVPGPSRSRLRRNDPVPVNAPRAEVHSARMGSLAG